MLRHAGPAAGAGIATGLLGVLLFGVVHAILIMPIWSRLIGGIPFSLAAGLAMAWAYVEFGERPARPGWVRGAGLGLLLWLSLIPPTLCGVAFRMSGFHGRFDTLETAVVSFTAVVSGAATGLALGGGWRRTTAFATAIFVLVLVMGGPVAVTNGRRPLWLYVAFAGIYLCGGIFLAAAHATLSRVQNEPRA